MPLFLPFNSRQTNHPNLFFSLNKMKDVKFGSNWTSNYIWGVCYHVSSATQGLPIKIMNLNLLSEYCVWAQKSEKSTLHAKRTYGALVRVTPSFHHHLPPNLLSSTFAPLWTYEENTEFTYNLWMGAARRGSSVDVSVFVCSGYSSFSFVSGTKSDNQAAKKWQA